MKTHLLFAASAVVVSVFALAACTVTTVSNPPVGTDGGTADGGTKDASKPETAAPPANCAVDPKAADFDSLYKPFAGRKAGACTAKELDAVVNAADDPATVAAVVASSAACSSCLLSKAADAKWSAVVTDAAGALEVFNPFGTCAEASTGSTKCGEFQSKYQNCSQVACKKCVSADDFEACVATAGDDTDPTSICEVAAGDGRFVGACTAADDVKWEKDCGTTYLSALTYLCGGTAP
jgi:hypothetical protein